MLWLLLIPPAPKPVVRDDYSRDRQLFQQASAGYNEALLKYPDTSPLLKDSKNLMEHFQSLKTNVEGAIPRHRKHGYSRDARTKHPIARRTDPQQEILQLQRQTNFLAEQLAEIARNQTNLEGEGNNDQRIAGPQQKIEGAALNSFMTNLEQNKMGGDQDSPVASK